MADVQAFTSWSSTNANNSPAGSTSIGSGLAPNLREIQAQVASWRDGTGYGILTLTSVSGIGSNAATASSSPAPTLASPQKYLLIPDGTNTGACTLNVNSAGAKNIYAGNSALVGGELHANIPVLIEYDGTQFQILGPVSRQPVRNVYTSGSAQTYTTPVGATRILVKLWGPGGGGGAQATNAGNNGSGATTFGGSLSAGAGSGAAAGASAGGAGGTASGGDINVTGEAGEPGITNSASVGVPGGKGGGAPFIGVAGQGGLASSAGGNAPTNSGGGGGGGGGTTAPAPSGPGGGSGAYCEKLITAPSATYTYTVGTKGTGGAAGGAKGGDGADGLIIVDAFFT